MIVKSLLTEKNPFNSTAELREWIERRNKEVTVQVKQIPFAEMDKWYSKEDGSLHHESGRFFSIIGIDVQTDYGYINHWRQPIINQPEVGYLGILTKEIDGILYCLMQAKIEPGNVNCVQISPTLQATKSNYSRVHSGKSPNYLEYFVNAKSENIILDQLQSEQGARFLRKRNRNIIIKVDEDIEVLPDFKWMTLGQIKELMHYDNLVNMDTRTVLSGLKISDYVSPLDDLKNISEYGKGWLLSSTTNHAYINMREHLSWLTNLKSKYDLHVKTCPINEMPGWIKNDMEIVREDGKFFKIIGVNVTISNREVSNWCQPLVQPMQDGICAFIVKKIHGIYHFLVQAKLECGNFDVMELAPTVQCLTGNAEKAVIKPLFYDYVINAPKCQVLIDALQSEEGGRFYHEQNRNLLIEADDDFPLDVPDNYTWMTLNQMYDFLKFNNYLNIQARSIISALNYK
ncbi:NDP-hexose 2,3-dehydratase family protein [uncultured Bacteroides sp.]|uniref:NDP-hexose 2,3-dehydratase family protein n=1 Tax=uncultured Bacteroides sp. TaxID=162156 RepID=UPI002605B610|nr:NDP-hexose 2,3-dehydratase family protein [uncultured Bacteroides sp.]